MPSLRELNDQATIDRRETSRLNARLVLVERDCQDWYAEATKVLVAGTEIGDLIRSQIPTSADYNPPTPPPVPPAPPRHPPRPRRNARRGGRGQENNSGANSRSVAWISSSVRPSALSKPA
jgi:hypothetical protein